MIIFSANLCLAAADDENLDSKENKAETKYEADSEECYDSSEKKFNANEANQSLPEDKISEKLDQLYNDCMESKGHEVEKTDNKEDTPEE